MKQKDSMFRKWSLEEKTDLMNLMAKDKRKLKETADALNEKYQNFRSPTACKSKYAFLLKHGLNKG